MAGKHTTPNLIEFASGKWLVTLKEGEELHVHAAPGCHIVYHNVMLDGERLVGFANQIVTAAQGDSGGRGGPLEQRGLYWAEMIDHRGRASIFRFDLNRPAEPPAAAPEQAPPSLEAQVSRRIEELFVQPSTEEGRRLWELRQVYRVISGEETGHVLLPVAVFVEMFKRPGAPPPAQPWEIWREPGYGPDDPGIAGFNARGGLGGGWTARWEDVRAAVDTVARRLLGKAQRGAPTEIVFNELPRDAVPWPAIPSSGAVDLRVKDGLVTGFSPATSAASDRARLFLADLDDYLSVAEARTASELRHRLREEPGEEALRATARFLGGVYPARPGQAALLGDLMRLVGAPEKTCPAGQTTEEHR